jgi:hypothetical protein
MDEVETILRERWDATRKSIGQHPWTDEEWTRFHKAFPYVMETARALYEAGKKAAANTD